MDGKEVGIMVGTYIDKIDVRSDGIINNRAKLDALKNFSLDAVAIVHDDLIVHDTTFSVRLVHIAQVNLVAICLKGIQLVYNFFANTIVGVEPVED